MSFPKSPKKAVRGTLKLAVRDPNVRVDVGDEKPHNPFEGKKDYAEGLQLNLGPGLSVSNDAHEVMDKQLKYGANRIAELYDRHSKCAACKAVTTTNMIDKADSIIKEVCHWFKTMDAITKLRFEHQRDGAILLHFDYRSKVLAVKVTSSAVEVGFYVHNGLGRQEKFRLAGFDIQPHIDWLLN